MVDVSASVMKEAAETMTEHCQLHITHLPDELNGRIIQFLPAKDALHFAESCKSMLQSLALSCNTVVYETMIHWSGGYLDGDIPRKHRCIPVVSHTHTVVVSLQWCDQGWGNLKGQIYVAASHGENVPPPVLSPSATTRKVTSTDQVPQREDLFDGGRLVYESPIASHTEESLHFSFSPKPDETYDLWYKPGGGGGHALTLRNVRIQMLVQGDVDGDLHRSNCMAAEHVRLILPTPELIVPQQQPSLGIFRFVKKMCCCKWLAVVE